MKRIICMMCVALLLLAGCTAQKETEASTQTTSAVTEPSSIPATTAPIPEVLDEATYEIVQEDRSIRNANGDVLVEVTYGKVVLLEETPEAAAINAAIETDCARFLAANDEESLGSAEDTEAFIQSVGMGYGELFSVAGGTVTHNGDGIFSICISTGWFMGGVFNGDYYGMTFDLHTGEQIPLERLSQLPAGEFEQLLKDIAAHWLWDTYGEGLFSPPEEVLAGYALEDFLYYVEDGEIILTFPTYTFTAGAAGASVIPTGLMVDIAE